MNWHWTPEELAYVLDDSEAGAFFIDERFGAEGIETLARLNRRVGLTLTTGPANGPFGGYEAFLAAAPDAEPQAQTMGAPMYYTSGTTGFPKGVRAAQNRPPQPADGLAPLGRGALTALRMPHAGTHLLCGPAYHSAQWTWSFLPLLGGNTVVMRDRFDPAETLDLIDRHKVTAVHLVPVQFLRLLGLDDAERERFDGSSLAAVWHGAAPCPPDVKRRIIDWFGPVIWEYYGGTEGGILSTCSSQEWLERPGTVGRILPAYEVKVLDDEGAEVATGSPGQVWFRNRTGADFEYHNAPEKTAAAHRAGYGTLGDVGFFDADSYLYLSDRKIDMIISGGVNIYPAEIEACLVNHAAVHDAAVFGIPNDEFGEEVKAVVELVPGAIPSAGTATDLQAHVRAHLAGYKVPRSFDFVDELPRLATGKLSKRVLRDPYWATTGRSI